uniref:Uncharacterized protein n=1 Tax=Acrobeloides nanus TaxID=290746 RepID=A0A914EG68_9BILA
TNPYNGDSGFEIVQYSSKGSVSSPSTSPPVLTPTQLPSQINNNNNGYIQPGSQLNGNNMGYSNNNIGYQNNGNNDPRYNGFNNVNNNRMNGYGYGMHQNGVHQNGMSQNGQNNFQNGQRSGYGGY